MIDLDLLNNLSFDKFGKSSDCLNEEEMKDLLTLYGKIMHYVISFRSMIKAAVYYEEELEAEDENMEED